MATALRIVAFSRCLVIKCRMTLLKVVSLDIFSDSTSGFPYVVVLCQISFFIFKAAEPAFNHDIICPSAFTIHALTEFRICGFDTLKTIFRGLMTILVSSVSSTSQPTIQRLYQSITAVRYRNPRLIGIYVMSIDHA